MGREEEMFEVRHFSDIFVMGLEGDLNLRNVRQFDSILGQALEEDVGRVILDLSHLEHIDYKLVAHLIDRMIEIQCRGGELKLAGGSRYISDILRAMGCDEEVYSSVEDAVISFAPLTEEEWQ